MPQVWENEASQCLKFREIIAKHYGIQLYAARVGPTDHITNGHISVGPYILAICGAKNWNGHRDPEVEASAYVLEAIRRKLVAKRDPLDVLPCVVIVRELK